MAEFIVVATNCGRAERHEYNDVQDAFATAERLIGQRYRNVMLLDSAGAIHQPAAFHRLRSAVHEQPG
jgi:hypothetical protein